MNSAPGVRSLTLVATLAALCAFAANSLLCRAALGSARIDAGSFTAIRIVSGALVLALIVFLRPRDKSETPEKSSPRFAGDWFAATALFAYALCFSLAYRSLSAGVGALLLFGSVQLTMIGWGLSRGERPRLREWIGLGLAIAGLAYLVLGPIVEGDAFAAPLIGSVLMALAGVAWGVYSLRGKGARDPIAATAGNFLRAAPLAMVAGVIVILALPAADLSSTSSTGVVLAVISGAITSGLGYVIWYRALPGLSRTQAATVQLAVPILTALAAVMLLSEPLHLRLIVSSILVLGGIALAVLK